MTTCSWCGEAAVLEIGEIWGHDFTIGTCCLASYEAVTSEMAADPAWATELLRHLGAEAFTGHRLRRLYDDRFSPPVFDFRLTIQPCRSPKCARSSDIITSIAGRL